MVHNDLKQRKVYRVGIDQFNTGRQKPRTEWVREPPFVLGSKGVGPHAVVKGFSISTRNRCSKTKHCPATTRAFFCAHSSGWSATHHTNPYSVLQDLPLVGDKENDENHPEALSSCGRTKELCRKAKKIVKLLRVDQDLEPERKLVPNTLSCLNLRQTIRQLYRSELTPVQELSIKTIQKVVDKPCDYCESQQEDIIENWKKERFLHCPVDEDHLSRFSRAFSSNVNQGWNKKSVLHPYIPNGNATCTYRRCDGGNWNDEPIGSEPRVELVYSSGKPRIVTLYAGRNIEVLTPLHNALYSSLMGRGWLLVGSPTDERLFDISRGTAPNTEWLSFDYKSATDKIKIAYVKRAVEVLIEKGEGLHEEEVRCMRLMSSLCLDGKYAESGQPMGSPMSFPLLCLINKTVVDMSLTDLLIKGEIGFNEWSRHRCSINGDDLLTKNTSQGDLVGAICENGSQVGLETNLEKTMRSRTWAEINSTAFKDGVLQKKTNVSSLWMSSLVSDVLGFSSESTRSQKGFLSVVRNNLNRLACQVIKVPSTLTVARSAAVTSKKWARTALSQVPSLTVAPNTNLFPVEPMPDGFYLSREEQAEVIRLEVDRVREQQLYLCLPKEAKKKNKQRKKCKPVNGVPVSRRKMWDLFRPKKTNDVDNVLVCLRRRWEENVKGKLLRADEGYETPGLIVSDLSGVNRLVDAIKAWKLSRTGGRPKVPPSPFGDDPIREGSDFVSLSGIG